MAAAANGVSRRSGKRSLDQIKQEIIDKLDIAAEYEAMGLRLAGNGPRPSGFCEAYAAGREDGRPSASINVNTGKYQDSSAECPVLLSLFDFAVRFGKLSGVTDFATALKYFASRAGVKISKDESEDPHFKLRFEDWDATSRRLAELWCHRFKPGVTLEAILAAGGRPAYWPCYRDKETGDKKDGRFRVVALPAWGHGLLKRDPACWVIWNMREPVLEIYRGPNIPAEKVKMLSVGPAAGTLMNLHALEILSNPESAAGIECIWKTGGPSDMMALWSIIPPEDRHRILVTTNASGETGGIPPHVANVFSGHLVRLIHDADEAGEVGVSKWRVALRGVARRVEVVKLPYRVEKKHGKDVRDWIGEGGPVGPVGEVADASTQPVYEEPSVAEVAEVAAESTS